MQQVDVERSQEFRKCIECFLCQDTCHVIRDHEENKEAFAGPRFFIRAAELDMHPLDARDDRANFARDSQGLGMCNITKCCTEVCPEHIKITDNAIIPLKERVADQYYDPIQWAWRKLRGGDPDAAPPVELPVLQGTPLPSEVAPGEAAPTKSPGKAAEKAPDKAPD
jgi:succinate dehydrogenase / fumarate reductase iron-sulfur subunit